MTFSKTAARDQEHRRRLLVDQGDRAMFHLGGRVALGVDVADFLELEGAFQADRNRYCRPR